MQQQMKIQIQGMQISPQKKSDRVFNIQCIFTCQLKTLIFVRVFQIYFTKSKIDLDGTSKDNKVGQYTIVRISKNISIDRILEEIRIFRYACSGHIQNWANQQVEPELSSIVGISKMCRQILTFMYIFAFEQYYSQQLQFINFFSLVGMKGFNQYGEFLILEYTWEFVCEQFVFEKKNKIETILISEYTLKIQKHLSYCIQQNSCEHILNYILLVLVCWLALLWVRDFLTQGVIFRLQIVQGKLFKLEIDLHFLKLCNI
eukprot:TRINITY_DN3224_c1_g1_i3.p1 TRINITY_DN3224_c1_g1~~TRINITY_DN3224_c1_g1_i3.p1  ORF type:complete len:259 (-),score=-1.97 TRINITY_DN3224_c1_g1_i3:190-966(-)